MNKSSLCLAYVFSQKKIQNVSVGKTWYTLLFKIIRLLLLKIKLLPFLGLEVYINRAEQLYTTLQVNGTDVEMSRADFWALAGIEAVFYSNGLATCNRCEEHLPNITYVKYCKIFLIGCQSETI